MMSTSEHQSPSEETFTSLPDNLVSPRAKLVYLTLTIAEKPTATELQRVLGLSKLTLLPILSSLSAKGLIQRTEDGYVTE